MAGWIRPFQHVSHPKAGKHGGWEFTSPSKGTLSHLFYLSLCVLTQGTHLRA